jgi:transposase-like protein
MPQKEYIPKKEKGQKFSTKDKIQCVKLVQLHGSLSKVAKMTGVTRQTLSRWLEDPAFKPKYEVNKEVIERRAQRKLERKESDFLKDVYDVKTKALAKMEELINTSKSLKDVTNAFAILHQIGAGDDPTDPDSLKSLHITQNNFITKIKQLREKAEQNNKTIHI